MPYNELNQMDYFAMLKSKQHNPDVFGQRMARLRQNNGYSQRELAKELNISPRMVAYYEAQTERPPAHLLVKLAKILSVTTDELLGLKEVKTKSYAPRGKVGRVFETVTKLPKKQQEKVVEFVSAFVNQYREKQG